MSEYIVSVSSDEAESFISRFGIGGTQIFGHQLVGEIVRCRDCKHYEYWEFRDGRTAHDCARGGDYLFDTEPDGFCAWAVRRDEWPTTS